jgi:hypothetical protein
MKNPGKNKLKDMLHEFMIMIIFGLGIALPLIIYNFANLLSRVNLAYMMDSPTFMGMY